MNKSLLFGIIIGVLFISGCMNKEIAVSETAEEDILEEETFIDRENNACGADSDCQYVWFAGGCKTPEYVSKVLKDCQDGTGPCPSEAPPRDGVTCTCENNKCITHG